VDTVATALKPDDFDALLIPGGHSSDRVRLDADVVGFTRCFLATGKPVAAICHGPQLLIEAGFVEGKTLTSWPSVCTDLINTGADWVDREVVIDTNLITYRKPDDLPAFCATLPPGAAVLKTHSRRMTHAREGDTNESTVAA
jgi:protease I